MTLKTYLFPEVAGHGEITEWVPADVARELLDSLERCLSEMQGGDYCEVGDTSIEQAEKAIKKSCGK